MVQCGSRAWARQTTEVFLADFVAVLARFILRAVLVAMGLVFVASLLVVVVVLASLWALRALWARLTGRPVTPWVMRVNPGAEWNRVFRAGERGRDGAAPGGTSPSRPGRELQDVTDVQIKEP